MLKRIPPERLAQYLAEAARHPLSRPAATYPAWYLHRWHFLPEGYLSRRSISLYDHGIRRLYHVLHEREALAVVTRWLGDADARRVIELGCGPGRGLEAMAVSLPAAAVAGVDLSPYMLERAQARVADCPTVELLHEDSAALPFADGSCDAVVAVHHLGHLPREHAEAVLREARRVLRPGGRLILADHRWHPRVAGEGFAPRRRRMVARMVQVVEYVRRGGDPGSIPAVE